FEYHPDTSGNGTQAIVTNNDNNITVAPNPTKASVIIASPYPMFSIGLYDTRGLKVLQLDNCGTCADIDLSTLPEGTYTASILTSQGHYSRKIVKR
ncbi:MAG: T9SS type A sorting domain-containing protein, partial [Bacteroidales bacterium]|nr:T9SS type A sorting domain-containing protein [Bacteroidales bacterium]